MLFWFFRGIARIHFHDHIHLCSGFELRLLPTLIGYYVLDTNLSIQVICALNTDLGLLGFLWESGLDDLLYFPSQFLPLPAHVSPSWHERQIASGPRLWEHSSV